ncbi:hypothetical protein BKA70DRAFT_1103473 [Coprinopsis sp. MPI-PUGE-AT-0042]|nr:hypothetical protein BKA70DRAFT_1103473 [Coprinopsis sp. MPI-PUGE-AT-0042]
MWGSSVFNTRIERLWLEVGTQFARAWRAFFYLLERRHLLDRGDKTHLWLLHHLFLDSINEDCQEFEATWNAHPISGEAHGHSPDDLMLLGQLEHGVYNDEWDDCEGCTEEEIQLNYGVEGRPKHQNGHYGAGNPEDEDEDEDVEMADEESDSDEGNGWVDVTDMDERVQELAKSEEMNIRHDPIEAPASETPFATEQELDVFRAALRTMEEHNRIPTGYGLLHSEWANGDYPPFEAIPARHRGKELQIPLPLEVWYPRAVQWARGHLLMTRMTSMY